MRTAHRIVLAGATAIGLSLSPGIAIATPDIGVTGKVIAQRTVAGKDYILREITIKPGGSTGWHYHDGTLHALVKQGTLTHTGPSCTKTQTYGVGSTFVEPSGAGHAHVGRNLGSTPLVLDVLYVNPAKSPLAEDVPNPGCVFQ
jgi:quercetin dioxygenase-like cupin family protein